MAMSPRDNMPGRKPFNPDRRCHWFDSTGRPYKRLDGGIGCPRNRMCYFAHPTDGDHWRNSRPPGDPPIQYLTDDEYRLIVGRHRSPGRIFHPPHSQVHHQSGYRHRSLSADRDRRRRERSPGRRRSNSRERAAAAAMSPPLAQRIRGRSGSKGREGQPVYRHRSSRSRSPNVRGRLLHRTPPPQAIAMGQGGVSALRASRPYGTIPEGPRNGGTQQGGTQRSSAVFPKVEATDVTMRDIAALPAKPTYRREESIASTHVPSQQNTPSRVPTAPLATTSGTVQVTATTVAGPSSSTVSEPDAIKSLLESSTLQWQQISSAVAAANSAVPKTNIQSVISDLSADEKNKIWTSRIELLAAITRIHNDCRSMENDIRDYKQLVESFSYQSLPAEDRTVIEGHLHTLQSQLTQKMDEMKKLLTKLSGAKFWSTYTNGRTPPPGQDSGQQEVVNQLRTLKESVSHLQGSFENVDGRWAQVLKQLQSNGNANIGNGDMNPATPRDTQASTFLAEAIVPSELEKIRDTLNSFQDRLTVVESEIVHQNESFLEQVDVIVSENLQSVVLAATGNVQAKPPAPRAKLSDEQFRMLQTLQQNAAATGQQVARLSQEVNQMVTRNEALQTENMALQAENAQLRQQLEELQVSHASHDGSPQADRMLSEMRALNAAVRAYITQGTSAHPADPTAEAVVKQIAPYIVKSIPEIVVPELNSLRDQLKETLRAQQAETMKELTLQLLTTQQTIEGIRGMIDQMQKSPAPHVGVPSQRTEEVSMNGVS